MGLHDTKDQKRYLTVLADGKLHERVDEDEEGAKVRTKKDKDGNVEDVQDKDGNDIYELTYPGITAMIKKVSFFDGDYGTNVQIDMEDEDDNQFCVSLQTKSNYGERFMEVLPNLDLNKEVELVPYAFTPKGKSDKVRGLTVKQDDEKVDSAFATKDEDGDWEVHIKGYPMPDPKKDYSKGDKWSLFFGQRRDWVMEWLEENEHILPADAEPTEEADDEEPEEDEVEEKPTKKKAKKTAKKSPAKKKKKADDEEDDSF